MRKILELAKSTRFLVGFTACAVALLSGFLLLSRDNVSVDELSAYNNAIELMNSHEYVDAVEQFGEVTVMLPESSELDAKAFYNMGYIVATQGDRSVDTLMLAKSFYLEALRISPDDVDTRKSIERLNKLIVDELMEQGTGEEDAEAALEPDEKTAWPKPSDGEDDSPGEGSEDDY